MGDDADVAYVAKLGCSMNCYLYIINRPAYEKPALRFQESAAAPLLSAILAPGRWPPIVAHRPLLMSHKTDAFDHKESNVE